MINKEKLGIYICTRGKDELFWSIHHHQDTQYVVSWGYIGGKPLGQKIIDENLGNKQIENKMKKGYSYKYQASINLHEFLQDKLEKKFDTSKKIKI